MAFRNTASAMLLCSLAALSTAYVLVHHQPPTVVQQTPQVVYHAQPPVVAGGGQPPIVVGPGGQPSVVYHHFAPGGVRPQLQPPVVLVRVVPGLLPPQQPPQPPFIEEVPPVFKNPPSDEDDSPKPRQRPSSGRPGNGHGPNCAGVDNKKGIAPPPTRKPSKQGRDVNPRTARKNPEKEGPRNPNRKHSRRPNPKSERIRSERLTLPKSG